MVHGDRIITIQSVLDFFAANFVIRHVYSIYNEHYAIPSTILYYSGIEY